ncbi:BQ2448_4383 [Microbotryum intermedium]|uniref:BQ2448_4383 protein n=1 Tax=Microbotryum intermedium TaxID=269621 RepID=A0A238FP25_9BASI|nr:BQ2448_4383 [Microbotryum intermedium]
MSLWSTSDDPQLASLKRQVGSLEAQLANQANLQRSLNLELNELKQSKKDDLCKLQEESQRAVVAEEQLRKRTEEVKLCQTQKANSQQACSNFEAKLKDEQAEVRRLNYQLESLSTSTATNGNATASSSQTRLVEINSALEQKVQQLTSDLHKVQTQLEQEKEKRPTTSAAATSFGFDRSRVTNSAAMDKSIALENENTSLKAEIALLKSKATSSGRTSAAPSPKRNSGSKFGFNSSAARASIVPPTPSRPASSLGFSASGVTSAIPKPSSVPNPSSTAASGTSHRRSSFVALPGPSGPTSVKLNQLTQEVEQARTKIEALESDLGAMKQKLTLKDREALTLENKLMAAQKSLADANEKSRTRLGGLEDQVEESKREVGRVRDTLRAELDRAQQKAKDEAFNSKNLIERLRAEVERKEQEVQKAEYAKDDVERRLEAKKDEEVKSQKQLEDLKRSKNDLDREVQRLKSMLEASQGSDAMERQLERVQDQLAGSNKLVQELQTKCTELERERELSQIALTNASKGLANEERSKLESEFEVIHTQLEAELDATVAKVAIAAEKIKMLEAQAQDAQEARSNLVQAETQIGGLKAQVASLDEQRSALEGRLAASEEARVDKETEIVALMQQLAAQDTSHIEALLSANEVQESLETERNELRAQVTSISEERDTIAKSVELLRVDLDVVKDELAAAASALTLTRAERDELASTHQAELDVCDEALQAAEIRIAELNATIEQLSSSSNGRSYEDAQVEALEAELEEAKQVLHDVEAKASQIEAESTKARESLQAEIDRLEAQIEEMDTVYGETMDKVSRNEEQLRADLKDREAAAERAEREVETATKSLDKMMVERDAAIDTHEDLQSKMCDHAGVEFQLVDLQSTIATLTQELESVRSSNEDATLAHLQDVNELQRRIQELEREVESLHESSESQDAGEAKLMRSKARIAELTAELETVDGRVGEAERMATDRVSKATNRAERAESDVLRLRTDLDRATRQLIDAQDQLLSSSSATHEREDTDNMTNLRASGPSPTFSSFSDSEAASILVQRLREERDDLRSRLDFSRNEQKFRVEALQDRLLEAEYSKANELARLEVALLERTVALETETKSSQSKSEEVQVAQQRIGELEKACAETRAALHDAKAEIERLDNALEQASKEGQVHEKLIQAEQDLRTAVDGSSKLKNACVSLQSKVDELEGRVMRRNAAIALHEQTIESLRLQVEPDDEGDTKEFDRSPELGPANAELANRVEELSSARESLQHELTELKDQLAEAQNELVIAKQAAIDASALTASLERQLMELTRSSVEMQQSSASTITGLREALDSAHGDMSELASRMGMTDQRLAEALDALSSTTGTLAQVQAQLSSELGRGRQLEQTIAELEHGIEQTHAELATVEAEAAEQMHVDKQRVRDLEVERNGMHRQLVEVQNELVVSKQKLEAATDTNEQVRVLQVELAAARRAVEDVRAEVAKEQAVAAEALADAQARFEEDKLRSDAEMDAAKREIHTLRQLGRTADDKINGLQSYITTLEQDSQARQTDLEHVRSQLEQLEKKSQDQLREVIDNLQLHERSSAVQIEAILDRNRDLERALEGAMQNQGMQDESRQQIEELEKQVEAKTIEAEELDEKVMDVLREQKRYVSQIERLKGKIESLTRDLKVARAVTTAAAPTPVPAPAPTQPVALQQSNLPPVPVYVDVAPISAAKKRRAPSEFDPLPSATVAPRAVMPPMARTPRIDKENDASARMLVPVALSTKQDGVVPLKPAALSPAMRRDALKMVERNDAPSYGPVVLPLSTTKSFGVTQASTVDSLKARLHGMGARV